MSGTGVLTATSARTGATLWQLLLPAGMWKQAPALTGRYVVLAYRAVQASLRGGVLLVDTGAHTVLW